MSFVFSDLMFTNCFLFLRKLLNFLWTLEAAQGLSAQDLQLLLNRAKAMLRAFVWFHFKLCFCAVEVQEAGAHKFVSISGFCLAAQAVMRLAVLLQASLKAVCGSGGGGSGGSCLLIASLTCPGADGAGGGGIALKCSDLASSIAAMLFRLILEQKLIC